MSEKCKHGVRDTATNLPYCRRCDAEAKSSLAAPSGSPFVDFIRATRLGDACVEGAESAREMRLPKIPERFASGALREAWLDGFSVEIRNRMSMENK
jgi:hypothetical protein